MPTKPLVLLRVEGLALLALAVTVYALLGGSWWLFLLLLFVPDISMLGYAKSPHVGAATYNLAHLTALPIAVGMAGYFLDHTLTMQLAAVWLAHIGLDRAIGYGLKHADSFGNTHLGPIGRSDRQGR